ncbi:MAG: pyruvate formate lyase activating [Desulfobulbaceae bacterium]|nr:MAG: pyruvate formate lyase activating [Desulfobulbaceae bacterium]
MLLVLIFVWPETMQIGGFHPASFNNYPGKVAAVVFTQGCNFCCPFCHNAGLIGFDPSSNFSEQDILARLAQRRGKLTGVVISGGEPTLQRDLLSFCRCLGEMGFAVKIDTNGSMPEMLVELIAAKVVDYIAMDLKAPLSKYDRLAGVATDTKAIRRSASLISESGLPHHFRTTAVESLLSCQDLADIRKLIPAGSSYIVQQFRPVVSL